MNGVAGISVLESCTTLSVVTEKDGHANDMRVYYNYAAIVIQKYMAKMGILLTVKCDANYKVIISSIAQRKKSGKEWEANYI